VCPTPVRGRPGPRDLAPSSESPPRAPRTVSIIGEAALPEHDRSYLAFAHDFEQSFVNQAGARRTIEDTLELAWKLLLGLPEADLKRIDSALLARYGNESRLDE
jgi:V/A-type H+-transporting ATPase subunit B